MEISRGKVILMNTPNELGRPRPGVVVQADEVSTDVSTVFVCPITSHIQHNLPLRPKIEASGLNGLRVQSQIMTDKMVALRRDRIRQIIGQIDQSASEQLDNALLIVLGLGRWAIRGLPKRMMPRGLCAACAVEDRHPGRSGDASDRRRC